MKYKLTIKQMDRDFDGFYYKLELKNDVSNQSEIIILKISSDHKLVIFNHIFESAGNQPRELLPGTSACVVYFCQLSSFARLNDIVEAIISAYHGDLSEELPSLELQVPCAFAYIAKNNRVLDLELSDTPEILPVPKQKQTIFAASIRPERPKLSKGEGRPIFRP